MSVFAAELKELLKCKAYFFFFFQFSTFVDLF